LIHIHGKKDKLQQQEDVVALEVSLYFTTFWHI